MVRRRVDSRTGGIREIPFAKMYKYKCILSVHLGEKVDCLRAQQLSQIIQLLPASTSPCATLMPPKLLPCITEGQFKAENSGCKHKLDQSGRNALDFKPQQTEYHRRYR